MPPDRFLWGTGPEIEDTHWAENQSGRANAMLIIASMTEKLLEWLLRSDKKEKPVVTEIIE